MSDNDWSLVARLHQLRAARVRLEFQRSALLDETRRVARAMVDRGESLRSVAEAGGLTHPTVAALMQSDAPRAHPGERIPTLELRDALQTLDAFGPVSDMWLAFNPADFLAELGLSPATFALGQSIHLPPTLLQNTRGEWLGVSDCLCGYGGTGPHNTLGLVSALGIDADAVKRTLFSNRFLHFDVADGKIVQLSTDPLTHLGSRGHVVGETVIVTLQSDVFSGNRSWLRWDPHPPDSHSFERQRNGEGNTLSDWYDELLSKEPAPPWTAGPLRARIYTSFEAAREAGLERHDPYGYTVATLIIEQGDLQLWCEAGQHPGSKLLSETALEALAIVDRDPPAIALTQRLRRPPFVEVGGPLVREPSDLVAALREEMQSPRADALSPRRSSAPITTRQR